MLLFLNEMFIYFDKHKNIALNAYWLGFFPYSILGTPDCLKKKTL